MAADQVNGKKVYFQALAYSLFSDNIVRRRGQLPCAPLSVPRPGFAFPVTLT